MIFVMTFDDLHYLSFFSGIEVTVEPLTWNFAVDITLLTRKKKALLFLSIEKKKEKKKRKKDEKKKDVLEKCGKCIEIEKDFYLILF